jgi:hypothetical protein
MSDYLGFVPKEVESREKFLGVLTRMPSSGMAYRGDKMAIARETPNNGLWRKTANYIVVVPPKEDWKLKRAYNELRDGVRWALTYADPWVSPAFPVEDDDFVDYYSYYRDHPESVYTLSWFTAPREDLFKDVAVSGKAFVYSESTLRVGNVGDSGGIPRENVRPLVVASLDDIRVAQDGVVGAMLGGKIEDYKLMSLRALELKLKRGKDVKPREIEREVRKPFAGFDSRYRDALVTAYLRGDGRWDFHHALADRMTVKLVDEMDRVF